ncbi:MAG: disulfide bond formation protein B [Neisseriaceae bacterium]|nr:MAG: disulfide bond formation protein B [Neisseriaceae bacterium]
MLTNLFRLISPRLTFALIFIFCASSIAYAFYSQFYKGADPCPLCIAQRIIYGFLGILSLVALINNCKGFGNRIYGILLLAIALFGVKTAYHHVWLQSLPPDQWPASCGMPLDILFKKIPLTGFIHTILSGTAECAMVSWKVFGFSGPLVSMWGYILVAIGAFYVLIHRKPAQKLY